MAANDNARAQNKTLEDFPTQVVRTFLTANHLAAHGDRAECIARLTANNNAITEATPLVGLTAATLREWATINEIGNAANLTRSACICRILDKTDPQPPPPAVHTPRALDAPKPINIMNLSDANDTTACESWQAEILLIIDSWGMSTQWEFLVNSTTTFAQRQVAENALNPLQAQNLTVLLRGMRNSISEDTRARFDISVKDANQPEVRQKAPDLWLFIKRIVNELGLAHSRKQLKKFSECEWRHSKSDLPSWVARLRGFLLDVGDEIPAGFPRETKLRTKILGCVSGDTDLRSHDGIRHILTSHKLKEITDPGYDVDSLVGQLMGEICKHDANSDSQSTTFGCWSDSQSQDDTYWLSETQNPHTQKSHTPPNPTAPNTTPSSNITLNVNTADGSSTSTTMYGDANSAGSKSKMFCSKCHKFYKDKNMLNEKQAAITSHDTVNCKHTGVPKPKPKAAPKKKNGPVQKSNDKKGGKKGKGKGKGKKGGGKKGKGKGK